MFRVSWYYSLHPKHVELQRRYLHCQSSSEETTSLTLSTEDHKESIERMRARLLYQSRKRGILETDLILSTFAKKYLPLFTKKELETYDEFLQESDWEIYSWVIQKTDAPEKWHKSNLLVMLREHCRDKRNSIQKMPELF
ncbi:hypothetical protein PMAC_001471 [Pneumocystis sp. 'macacae']|nr:hypothetical protein PMAC_001471 [Pneumocystis sp. 'macacae']